MSEGSDRVPLRFIHPSELRSFGSRSRGRGRPRSVRAFRQRKFACTWFIRIYGGQVRFSYEIRESEYEFSKVYLSNKFFARFPVLLPEVIHIRETQGGEGAEAEKVAGFGKGTGLLDVFQFLLINYIILFQQVIESHQTQLSHKNGLPSTTKKPLTIVRGFFVGGNITRGSAALRKALKGGN